MLYLISSYDDMDRQVREDEISSCERQIAHAEAELRSIQAEFPILISNLESAITDAEDARFLIDDLKSLAMRLERAVDDREAAEQELKMLRGR